MLFIEENDRSNFEQIYATIYYKKLILQSEINLFDYKNNKIDLDLSFLK